ncbi:hypothetical protein CYMTET_35822, partial [Cymbomonas tetramitiformis]
VSAGKDGRGAKVVVPSLSATPLAAPAPVSDAPPAVQMPALEASPESSAAAREPPRLAAAALAPAAAPARRAAPILQLSTSTAPPPDSPVKSTRLPVPAKGDAAVQGTLALLAASPSGAAKALAGAAASGGELAAWLPTEPLWRQTPLLSLAVVEQQEAEHKRRAATRIAAAWKASEERAERAALRQAAVAITRRHVRARVTRMRFVQLRAHTVRCQALVRGKIARKAYTEIWFQIAIKEGLGYLLKLRQRKFETYLGFARRESSITLQAYWKMRRCRAKFAQMRLQQSQQRTAVLFDLWEQAGTALTERRTRYGTVLNAGPGSLYGLSILRGLVLQVAHELPHEHLKAEAARRTFQFPANFSITALVCPAAQLTSLRAAELAELRGVVYLRRRESGLGLMPSHCERLSTKLLEDRHRALRNERVQLCLLLKAQSPSWLHQLYSEWGIQLQTKGRMQTLVMTKLWLDPRLAEQSEMVMQMVMQTSAARPRRRTHAMRKSAVYNNSVYNNPTALEDHNFITPVTATSHGSASRTTASASRIVKRSTSVERMQRSPSEHSGQTPSRALPTSRTAEALISPPSMRGLKERSPRADSPSNSLATMSPSTPSRSARFALNRDI